MKKKRKYTKRKKKEEEKPPAIKDKGNITVKIPSDKRMEVIKTLADSVKSLCDAVAHNSISIKIQNNTAGSISIGEMSKEYGSQSGLITVSKQRDVVVQNCLVDGRIDYGGI